MTPQDTKGPAVADLYGEMLLSEASIRLPKQALFHGMAVVSIAACAAAWLSEHYGVPIILMGLLIGLSLNFLSSDTRTHAGLDFAGTTCLRLGIVILGTQVTFAQISALGPVPFVGIVSCMILVIAAGILAARMVGQGMPTGLLAGGATAICGASAALALYGVIGKERISQAQFTLTLVSISLASALAMSFYPIIASYLGLNETQAGFLIGASVHDVAQAIGGGYAFSERAGETATIIKLARVALLAPVIALASIILGGQGGGGMAKGRGSRAILSRLKLPWFIIAFFGVVALNSVIPLPERMGHHSLILSKGLLLLAVTATAMRSRLDLLLNQGWRGVWPVFAATFTSFIISLLFACFLI